MGLIIKGFNHWGKFVALSLQNSDKILNSALGIDPREGLAGRGWRGGYSKVSFPIRPWGGTRLRGEPEGARWFASVPTVISPVGESRGTWGVGR